MKKLIAMLLVIIMTMSLVACVGEKPNSDDDRGKPFVKEDDFIKHSDKETKPTVVDTEPTTEGTEPSDVATEPSTEATEPVVNATEPSVDVTEPIEDEPNPPVVDPDVIDISNALESTSAEAPAQVGEWIKSTKYSPASGKYETIYWRVIETTFDCQDDIDRYNGENHIYEFTPVENEYLAYCKVVYQVYFPKEFPAKEWGISACDISLCAKSPKGGGIEYKGVAYIGLGQTMDITKESESSVIPGDVFTGESIFVMVNDPSIEYVFEYYHVDEDTDGETVYDYSAYK